MAQNETPIILDETEQKIIDIIDSHRDQIIDFAKDIYTHAELGYKEFRTAEKFANFMKALGLPIKEHLAVTGVKAYLNEEKKDNVSLALIGELDALRIPEHKYANPETQGAHCCGHHAQLAGVIGAAIALTSPEVKEKLDSQEVLFAVPIGAIQIPAVHLIGTCRCRFGYGKGDALEGYLGANRGFPFV